MQHGQIAQRYEDARRAVASLGLLLDPVFAWRSEGVRAKCAPRAGRLVGYVEYLLAAGDVFVPGYFDGAGAHVRLEVIYLDGGVGAFAAQPDDYFQYAIRYSRSSWRLSAGTYV